MKERLAWSSDVPYKCQQGDVLDQFGASASSGCVMWPWNTEEHPQACGVQNLYVKVLGHYRLLLEGAAVSKAEMMASELVANGPFAVDFCVRLNFFSFWKEDATRIYTEIDGCKYGQTIGGHMATIIGFGTKTSLPYWTLENSWSSAWAHSGHFYMEKGINLCGVENKATFPDVSVSGEEMSTSTINSVPAATSTSLGEISTSFGEEASVSSTRSTSSSTTTTTLHDFQVVYSGVDNNSESAGVPLSVFLGTILGLLILWALTTSAAVMVWCRYDKLRRTIRSERPNFFPGLQSSNDHEVLRENRDAAGSPIFQPPQMMGQAAGGTDEPIRVDV
jgi:hypothetical protein